TVHSRRWSLISSAALWITCLIVGVWFLWATSSVGYAVPAIGVVGIAAVAGFSWQKSRTRAKRRRAAWDAHARREIVRSFLFLGSPAAEVAPDPEIPPYVAKGGTSREHSPEYAAGPRHL